jgi:hypothetical protein
MPLLHPNFSEICISRSRIKPFIEKAGLLNSMPEAVEISDFVGNGQGIKQNPLPFPGRGFRSFTSF